MSMDTGGVPPTGATGAGLGGLLPAVNLIPWVAGAVVLGSVGAVLGLNGVFGRPPAPQVSAPFSMEAQADGLDCPGGSAVTTFGVNDRVLVLARSEDSAYLEVRDTYNLARSVWVPASLVTVDAGQSAIESLDVGSCPEPIVTINTDAVVVVPEGETPTQPAPGPAPAPAPAPAPVDNPPVVQTVSVSSPAGINCDGDTLTLSASAADDKGISSVSVTWSGHLSGSASLSGSGANWSTVIASGACDGGGNVTFSFVARDTANQASAAKTTVVVVTSFD